MDDRALMELALGLAERAAGEIMAVRAAGFTVAAKADLTPVTLADTRAERVIAQGLRAATPAIAVIAEEEIAAGHIPPRTAHFWLVDPLDGTRGFAAGGDDFTVNIGLVRDGRAVLGVVACPATGELFCGIPGRGAWKKTPRGIEPIAVRARPAAGLTAMGSRHYRDDPRLAQFLAGHPVAVVHHIGSAQKFLRIAEGKADLYPRLGPTLEWDTAAPQAVLEAAGGSTMTFEGAPLAYGKPGFLNPPFLCRGGA